MDNDYSAKDIVVLTGAQGIRKRPGMYIGSTGSSGFTHLLYEVIDNSVDEATAGYCKNIYIKLTNEDNMDVAEVSDDGRGIPVDIMPGLNKPALEVIMTSLHSGAKFNNKTYKVSGGLHGVGVTVVNALSEYVQVTVKKEGKVYEQQFSRGLPISELKVIGDTKESGTTMKFKPDKEIFSVSSFDTVALIDRLRDITFLNPGLKITLVDARDDNVSEKTFYSEKGVEDFIAYIRDNKEEISKPIVITKEVDSLKVSVALQYVKSYSEELLSFVNNIKTPEGGMHVSGLHSALTRSIASYIQKNIGKKSLPNIEGEDTREGLIGIVSVLMENPEFEGQTKEKLGNTYVKQIVENAVYTELNYYLEENPTEANKIIEKIVRASEAREAAKRARELARKKSLFEGSVLPGKLADCTENDPSKSEIFIVEGDSAAGSSKQGRDRMFQAIMPLRGKVLNVEKASTEKIFANAELHTLVTALGTGIKDSFNADNVRYHKIIFLTDADVDGSHIETLLLTFFYRYLKEIIERGYVYSAQPPLYKIVMGKEIKYAYSDDQLNKILEANNGKGIVNRYKGLGEMNPDQLWETTMNPENRILKKILIKDAELANSIFNTLMGANVEDRRKFLEAHSTEVSFLDI